MAPTCWWILLLVLLSSAATAAADSGGGAAEDPHHRVIKKKTKNRKEVRRDSNRRAPEQTDQARTFSRVEPLPSSPGGATVGATKQQQKQSQHQQPQDQPKKKRGRADDDDLGHTRADLGKSRRGGAGGGSGSGGGGGGAGGKKAAVEAGACPTCPAPPRTRLKVSTRPAASFLGPRMPLHMFTDTSALTIQEAIRRFWRGELRQAYGCACHVTSVDKVDLQVSLI
jgi:hypothetical protein